MELVFLTILFLTMIAALSSGFPVAFALPGSAILTIGLAALCGYAFVGDTGAFFAQDGPTQWLTAGITNFRGIYWEVERDTLIAIPLFVFMGIMLQKSKIAEDLLLTMAQLFGPIPGGLGISVVFVGALLAATTGIVGATVVAMGLISLPAMMRNNYSKPLATGTICASGTLGQIIPPSIVLIILADQLSSAADQAMTVRKAEFKEATGEFAMPSEFDVTSASAGDMFLGAFLPGLILVGLYMAYILIYAQIRPKAAPPVHYDGAYDARFALRVLLALVPPLALIFAVLGSIIMGIATVNQAGAIGAIGAMIMAGYRLMEGKRNAFYPAILAVVSIVVIFYLQQNYDLNIKNATAEDAAGITMAVIAVAVLMGAVLWSTWRTLVISDTLRSVCIETAKTTSMVFIILLGAAMLTAAFRAFGGEELVKNFLTGLPGGFVVQFIVVMAVIFLLGFFLDFIEIAVVVVPIMAPILLADPSANITAVWLGVMIGVNMQTSFLTPPFGFSLFYLRGVAPPTIKTTQIYKGAIAFIMLQLVGLAIVGFYPPLVNYLPNRTYLTSVTAPPPKNPKLQECMESWLFGYYAENASDIRNQTEKMQALDFSILPADQRKTLEQGFTAVLATFDLIDNVKQAERDADSYAPDYRPIHRQVRSIESSIHNLERRIEDLDKKYNRASSDGASDAQLSQIESDAKQLEQQKSELEAGIPSGWTDARKQFLDLAKAEKTARTKYRRNVDNGYEAVQKLNLMLAQAEEFATHEPGLSSLLHTVHQESHETAMSIIKEVESGLSAIEGTRQVKSLLSKARRALKGAKADPDKSLDFIKQSLTTFNADIEWRRKAKVTIGAELEKYDDLLKKSIGIRLQPRLTTELAEEIASCRSVHRDISLNF